MRLRLGGSGNAHGGHECLGPRPAQRRPSSNKESTIRSRAGAICGWSIRPLIVFAELSWVLRGRWEKERVLNALNGLLRARGVTVESPTLARKALEAARNGAVGFADHLIAEISFDAGVKEIITFDRALDGCRVFAV
jgi:PIN domain